MRTSKPASVARSNSVSVMASGFTKFVFRRLIAAWRSVWPNESIDGWAEGMGEGDGDADLFNGGVCASPCAASKTEMAVPDAPLNIRLLLAVRGTQSNIAPVMTTLELDQAHRFISGRARFAKCRPKRGHRQYPAARSRNRAVRLLRPGVKNLNRIELRCRIQPGNDLARLIFSGITSRREHDCDRSPVIPFDRTIVYLAVNRRFQ